MRGRALWRTGIALGVFAGLLLAANCQGDGGSGGKKGERPGIILITPESGDATGGDAVMIVTSGFGDDFMVNIPRVFFDTVEAAIVTVIDPTSVEVITAPDPNPDPSGPRPVAVEVQSATTGAVATLASGFTYKTTPPVTPCFTIVPDSGGPGTPVILSRIDGSCSWNVAPFPTVTFGGVSAVVFSATPTQLACATPAGVAAGPVDVEVSPTFDSAGNPCVCILPGGFTFQ